MRERVGGSVIGGGGRAVQEGEGVWGGGGGEQSGRKGNGARLVEGGSLKQKG